MAARSSLVASAEQVAALRVLAGSAVRGEVDRARAMLLTLAGWTAAEIGEAFAVREDSVRRWRAWFAYDGVDALGSTRRRVPRLRARDPGHTGTRPAELDLAAAARRGRGAHGRPPGAVAFERVAVKGGFRWGRPHRSLIGRQDAREAERVSLRLQLHRAQAEADDIVLLYGDASEALTPGTLAAKTPTRPRPCPGPFSSAVAAWA